MQINKRLIGAAAALSLGLLPMFNAAPAQAIGCASGAAMGAAAGHLAHHHALLGALAGCVYGHHMHHKAEEERRKAETANPH